MQPADMDVELDECMFIEALMPLQDSMRLSEDADEAWRELLVTGYDLCFSHLHGLRTERRNRPFSSDAERFIDVVFSDANGHTATEDSLAKMHERILEFVPAFDPETRRLHIERTARQRRHQNGAFYTPDAIIDGLLDRALDPLLDAAEQQDDPLRSLLAIRICDPACGTGHFLARAAERIVARATGHASEDDLARVRVMVLRDCLHGSEIDPISVHVCRRRLWSLGGDNELPPSHHDRRIHHGSGLLGAPIRMTTIDAADGWCRSHLGDDELELVRPVHWNIVFDRGFDLVIGNPPFLNQLGRKTSLARNATSLLRDRFGDAIRSYTDPAAIFLRLSMDLARPGGRIAMIQPQSMLAARDTLGIRRDLAKTTRLTNLWLAIDHVFDAAVHVCAPVFERTDERITRLHRSTGADFARMEELDVDMDALAEEATWSLLVSDLVGIPRPPSNPGRTTTMIGDLADATADFRDQYYGLRGMVSEAPEDGPDAGHVPLVTTGLIDPAASHWGRRTMRYDRRKWMRPQVDLHALALETKLGPWADARLVPKILLATQTKVLEAYVDEIGELLPMTPLITVVPRDPDRLWHIAAALTSPVTTATAAARYFGVARSSQAIKLAASQVLSLPAPRPGPHWDKAADAFRAANETNDAEKRAELLGESAVQSCRAYGCPPEAISRFMAWWTNRLGV
ncbi:MAG: hypothetical protein CMJ24_06240 [Phycisphaerae bacterium]|nr:hypothetical protein [Phycisphaerae bacterium]